MARHAPIPLPGHDADEHSCTLWYIRRRLGRLDYSGDRMVAYVTALVDGHGFPKPFPRMKRKALVDDVAIASTWPRVAVDQWLLDWLPPEAGAALDAAARREAADTMDHRAAGLQLGRGKLKLIDGGRP